MRSLKADNIPINTKQIRKALCNVLKLHSDVMSDGGESTNSSAGSDKAPSEDNLDVEEIAEVIPIEEDSNLSKKFAMQQMNKYKENETKIIISPLKKRVPTIPKKFCTGKAKANFGKD